jgi:alpha-galactosidase
MDIMHSMEKHCPQALFINFTNPMQRICDAVHRYSSIRVVGLCHQISAGYAMVGRALGGELGIELPAAFIGTHSSPAINPARQQVALAAMKKVAIKAAGVNHFTWMLALTDRKTGEDLYPQFAKRWQELNPNFEPLTRRMYELFGLFPIPGDEHLCEYLPWMSDPLTKPWEKYDLSLYEWDLRSQLREKDRAQIRTLADGRGSLEKLVEEQSEGAAEVIQGVVGGKTIAWDAVNLPNHGLIENLPEGAIVEVPGRLGAKGSKGARVGALPEGIAELCRREITVSQLCVDAAVKGDRRLALQCLLLDPVVRDIDTGQKILDAYLKAYSKHLPQFE